MIGGVGGGQVGQTEGEETDGVLPGYFHADVCEGSVHEQHDFCSGVSVWGMQYVRQDSGGGGMCRQIVLSEGGAEGDEILGVCVLGHANDNICSARSIATLNYIIRGRYYGCLAASGASVVTRYWISPCWILRTINSGCCPRRSVDM